MWLSEIKTFDLDPKEKYIFLVSLGSLEQHGSYLPLSTDSYIQDFMLQKVESKLPEVIFLPTIPITCSDEHLGFLGTVSLKKNTLKAMLNDILDSLRVSADTVLFLSWHGGNKSVINDFIKEEEDKGTKIKLAQVAFGDENTDLHIEKLLDGPLDDHAGNTEISMMAAINSRLVRKPNENDPKEVIDFAWDKPVIEVTSKGIIDSHPKWIADSSIGEKIIDIFSLNLVKEIKKLIAT